MSEAETGTKVQIDDFEIYYEKYGNGKHNLLLIPGFLATPEIDFPYQLSGLDKSKFTLYAIHPPGCGNSRPPLEKNFKNHYQVDSQLYGKFMEKMSAEKYSILGYSESGRHACWLANQNPSVEKLILVSTSAYGLERERRLFFKFRDISLWNEEKRNVFEKLYGKEGLSKNYNNFLKELNTLRYMIPPEVLKGINCPTLIMHGERDIIVDPQHAIWLQKRIKNSKLWMFNTDHSILKDKHNEVNRKIQEFLLNQINQTAHDNQEIVDEMFMMSVMK